MKKHVIHTMISAMVIWAVYNPAAAISAEDDQVFVEMINQIRTDPYNYAQKYLECTPDFLESKGIEPDTTFALYILDEGLTATAETESQSMAGEDISYSEEPPVRRLTGTTGGAVSFFNFMSREEAFKIVIDYLFKEELDTSTFNHILSEEYTYVGIAISAGKVGSGNAWFVSIRLGSSELVSEIQMLNMINQIRADPGNIWEYEYNNIKLNQADVFDLNPNIPDLFTVEYKPLFFNAALSASASEAEADLETDTYHDYEGEVVKDFDVPPIPNREDSDQPVDFLFFSLIYKELISWPMSYVVFLNDIQDVGSSITFQPSDNEIGDSILSFVVGQSNSNSGTDENADSINDQGSRIYGVLFSDNDGDGLYAPGEELIQQDVTVSVYVDDVDEMQEIETVHTDNAGHFSMTLETNRKYHFTVTIDGVPVSWGGNDGDYLITSDQFVKLKYSPLSIEDDLLTVDVQ